MCRGFIPAFTFALNIFNIPHPFHPISLRSSNCPVCVYLLYMCVCVYSSVFVSSNRKKRNWLLRACWISFGASGDQSGYRCRMTTSESGRPPPPRLGTRVAIWTVKGKSSRQIQLHPSDRKWWYREVSEGRYRFYLVCPMKDKQVFNV